MTLVCPSCRRHHETCDCPASVRRTPLVPQVRAEALPLGFDLARGPIITANHLAPLPPSRPLPTPPSRVAG